MPRPRKSSFEQIEDNFADLSPVQQERLLATLATIHRLRKRQPGKEPKPEAPEPQQQELSQ